MPPLTRFRKTWIVLVQHRIYSQVCKKIGVEEKSERLIIITFDDSFSSVIYLFLIT